MSVKLAGLKAEMDQKAIACWEALRLREDSQLAYEKCLKAWESAQDAYKAELEDNRQVTDHQVRATYKAAVGENRQVQRPPDKKDISWY